MPFESFDQIRELFRSNARRAFLDLQRRSPGESIYGFGLATDDDTFGASVIGVTEAWYLGRIKDHEQGFLNRAIVIPAMRWATDEWPGIYSDEFPSTASWDPVEELDSFSAFAAAWTSQPGKTFDMFRAKVFRTMVEALQSLDDERLFGTGADRDKLTLILSISDSKDSGWLEMESAWLLNPRVSARKLTAPFIFPLRMLMWTGYYWHRLRHGRIVASE